MHIDRALSASARARRDIQMRLGRNRCGSRLLRAALFASSLLTLSLLLPPPPLPSFLLPPRHSSYSRPSITPPLPALPPLTDCPRPTRARPSTGDPATSRPFLPPPPVPAWARGRRGAAEINAVPSAAASSSSRQRDNCGFPFSSKVYMYMCVCVHVCVHDAGAYLAGRGGVARSLRDATPAGGCASSARCPVCC